jgi:hypothetical protein
MDRALSGVDPDVYLEQKLKMEEYKRLGLLQDGNRWSMMNMSAALGDTLKAAFSMASTIRGT